MSIAYHKQPSPEVQPLGRPSAWPWRHVPPTAYPVCLSDLCAGLSGALGDQTANAWLRAAVAEWTGNRDCLLVGSGRAALAVILMALRRGSRRTRVVVPAYTCPTVVQAVLAAGLEPVFCDVSPETLDLDEQALARMLDRTLLAVIVTHLYGWAQDIRGLLRTTRELGICLVEDAAQAFGATVADRAVGTWGDVGFYSLGRGKCVPAGGGGVIVSQPCWGGALADTAREQLALPGRGDLRPVVRLAAYALATRPAGWWFVARSALNPAREGENVDLLPALRLVGLPPATAAIGAALVARLPEVQAVRVRNAGRLMTALSGCEGIAVPRVAPGAEPVFLRLPVVMASEERAARLYRALTAGGLGVSRSYRRIVPDLFAGVLPAQQSAYPGASHLASCLLTLPTHPFVGEADLDRICAALCDHRSGGTHHAGSAAR